MAGLLKRDIGRDSGETYDATHHIVDLLHAYSKQSPSVTDPAELMAKAQHATRRDDDITKPRTARQLRAEHVEALIASYRATGSVAATAREFGITRQTVGQHLARAGIVTVNRMSDEQQTRAVQRYREGATATAIGREVGFSTHAVLKVLRNQGIEIRR